MKYIIIIILILIIITVAVKLTKKSAAAPNEPTGQGDAGLNNYYNLIKNLSCNELDKMHSDLLPLCRQTIGIEAAISYVDEYGQPEYNSKEEFTKRVKAKLAETLPADKQIYGCKTYGEARELNYAVVKRLDELESEG